MIASNYSSGQLHPPLIARNGSMLRVLLVCRISTIHHDEMSLEDQADLLKRIVHGSWHGP